jgi:hypothetical protein
MDDKQKKICATDSIESLMKSNCWKGDFGFACCHTTHVLARMSICQSVQMRTVMGVLDSLYNDLVTVICNRQEELF